MTKILWPNLFVVGAPRSGTTALYNYLRQHPEIFMTPAKEPGFMAIDGPLYDLERRHSAKPSYFVSTSDGYQALFRHYGGEKKRGEATPHYLHSASAPLRIHHYAPESHIVAIFRSPTARAHSDFMRAFGAGRESRNFDQVILAALRGRSLPAMLAGSYYADAIGRYQKYFDQDQMLYLLTEDLDSDPKATMKLTFEFLGVDADFVPDTSNRPNRSGVPRSAFLYRVVDGALDHRLMKLIHRYGPRGVGQWLEGLRDRYYEIGLTRQTLAPEQEKFYNRSIFGRDIERLQTMIGRDLSHWLA